MIPRPGEDNWDFTPVIDLIYSLSTHSEDYTHQKKTGSDSSSYASLELFDSTPNREKNQQVTQLGNFDKVWQYLGQPIDLPPPTVPTGPLLSVVDAWETNDEGEQGTHKGVKWWDGFEGVDLTANDENKIVTGIVELNKTQRKKERRKQRRNALAAQLTDGGILRSNGEDEPEPEPDIRSPTAPDRRAIIYQIVHQTTAETGIARLRSGKIFKTENPIDHDRRPANPPKSAKQIVQIPKPPKEGTFEIAAARKKTLMSMLREKFVDDRQYLNNLSFVPNLNGNHDATAEGIHVFVDASNIMIGFHNAVKMSRGQPINQRIRRQPLSFHNLSLILERGRPASKRIVVGSDNFPATQEAKQIGYEINILDRVHKAKELTPRQKKFTNGNGTGTLTGTGTGSGSETTAVMVQYAPEKWVEQAVDEILHLKMMESVVDASEPSTMVLATGDAAEAEYSGGFLKMVERALGKGWRIELASFRHNTSGAYKRREFRQKWGERFKTVELDSFVELLLGSE